MNEPQFPKPGENMVPKVPEEEKSTLELLAEMTEKRARLSEEERAFRAGATKSSTISEVPIADVSLESLLPKEPILSKKDLASGERQDEAPEVVKGPNGTFITVPKEKK